MDYITLDFETANSSLTSACAIGIVGVTNDLIDFEEYFLINPKEPFSEFNTFIHKITEEDCIDALTFPEVWEKISKYFENTIVFAHNADFDLSVLKAMLNKYGLDIPYIKYSCTLKVSRIVWKEELNRFRLSTVSSYLGVEHNHHNALSDARVCYEIIKRANKVLKTSSIYELQEVLGLRFGALNSKRFYPPTKINKHYKKSEIIKNIDLNDKSVYLAGKPKDRSKKIMSEELLRNGVYLEKDISRALDYFIVLGNCPKSKLNKVIEFKKNGAIIQLISEEDIYQLLLK
jgi:DNA polymerase-3 subunit epsilon